MKNKLKRTNETYLSDDELIIFDLLFDTNDTVNSLIGGKDFELHHNYQSHNLNVIQLKDTFDKFVNDGLMRLKLVVPGKIEKILTYVGLTEKGGVLWEKERCPLWEKFVADISSEEKDYWELSIYSPTLEAAKEFIEISHECHLYDLEDKNKIEIQQIEGKDIDYLIPWKVFNKLYRIKAQLSERHGTEKSIETDWELYEKKMKWWRDVNELQNLQNTLSI